MNLSDPSPQTWRRDQRLRLLGTVRIPCVLGSKTTPQRYVANGIPDGETVQRMHLSSRFTDPRVVRFPTRKAAKRARRELPPDVSRDLTVVDYRALSGAKGSG